MIKTEEYFKSLKRRKEAAPGLIVAANYLPFIYEYVPIITKLGRVMRGNLQMGDGYLEEEGELFWRCQPMNHGPGEKRLELDDVAYWIG